MFEPGVDADLQNVLSRRVDENSKKRPDIAIFTEEGSAVIIEFKAPGVQLDEHTGDLYEYAHLIAAKSNGRIKRIYGYLIGDTWNSIRLGGWTPFSSGRGWFRSDQMIDPQISRPLGEVYFEVLSYGDLVDRARKRIEVYKEKLQLDVQGKS